MHDDDTWLGSDGTTYRTCWACGGAGYFEGECTCMDDTCCCLHPEPPTCDVCEGSGSYPLPAPEKEPDRE